MSPVVGVIVGGCDCGRHILATFLMADGSVEDRVFDVEEVMPLAELN